MHRLANDPSIWLTTLTIDGPSASGKSSVSMHVAAAVGGVAMLTGRHYRSVTYAMMQRGIDLADQGAVSRVVAGFAMRLDDSGVISIDGTAFSDATIESRAVEAHVSSVASNDDVRASLIALQRSYVQRFASREFPVVIEGRDAGTRIAPDAQLRYYLSASAEARGKRRYGQRPEAERGETQQAIEARDLADSGHDRATEDTPGLMVIHTDEMTQPQVVARIMRDLV
ncbi:MAG: (d)CMP kinase [Phycisphaerales bacterium]